MQHSCFSCMGEVREKVPSFQKVTLYYDLKYSTKTLSIYVFVCLKMLMTTVIYEEKKLKSFVSIRLFVFATQQHKTITFSSQTIDIRLKACK